ncbi:MAG TPA: hypothetical protein VFE47_26040 [Tepidisphaeraceae bacterium]|jgi:hypothetical protein|nr:hypothetical protein [Tepidisphaeraceae bacterium]
MQIAHGKAIYLLAALLLITIGIELSRTKPPVAPSSDSWESPRAAALALLDHTIDDLSLENTTVRQIVDVLRKKTGVAIDVDWAALEKWNDTRIDVELHDAKLGDVIAFLFSYRRSCINDATIADFGVDRGAVVIAAAEKLPAAALTERIYDVRDLLSDEYWGCSPGTLTPEIYNNRAQAICRVLHDGTEVQNWKDTGMGGSRGSHEMDGEGTYWNWGGRLFITQTDYNQRLVESALTRLRTGKTGPMSLAPLDRKLDHLEFNAVSPASAFHVIGVKARASIICDGSDFSRDRPLGPPTPITMRLDHTTLEAALAAVTSPTQGITFNEYGNGIIGVGAEFGGGVMEAVDASALVKQARGPLAVIDPATFYGEMPTPTASGEALLNMLAGSFNNRHPYILATRIMCSGHASSRRQVRGAIEALSHPVSLGTTRPAVAPAPHIAHFACDNASASEVLRQLRQAAGPNIIWHLTAPIVDNPDQKVSVAFDDTTPQAIAQELMQYGIVDKYVAFSMQDGVLCVDPADGDTPKIFRAYDIASIMDHFKPWYERRGYDSPPNEKEKVERISDLIDAENPPGYWHGRLLVFATPLRQQRLFYYLRALRDGKPPPIDGFR